MCALSITDWILLATLAAILWYSWETRELKKVTILATQLGSRPLLTARMDGANMFLELINIGRGHAFKISVGFRDKKNRDNPLSQVDGYIDLIKTDEHKRLAPAFSNLAEEQKDYGKLIQIQLDRRGSKIDGVLVLRYSDIVGTRYLTEIIGTSSRNFEIASSVMLC